MYYKQANLSHIFFAVISRKIYPTDFIGICLSFVVTLFSYCTTKDGKWESVWQNCGLMIWHAITKRHYDCIAVWFTISY